VDAVDIVAADDVHEDVDGVVEGLRLAGIEPEVIAVALDEIRMGLADVVGGLFALGGADAGAEGMNHA